MRLHGHSVTGTMKPDAQAAPAGPLLRTGARPLSLVATAALTLLVLAACSPPESAPPPENEPQNGNTQPPKAGAPPAVRSPSADLMSDAARNAPRSGSVTQGSRGVAGITADSVSWTGSGVRIQERILNRDVTAEIDPESGLRYFTDSGQTAIAAVVSYISSGSDRPPRPGFNANDPVVFGPWMYRTANGFVWGMFVDGLAASEASGSPGTYRGTTIGVYTDDAGIVDFFTARVEFELAPDGSLTGLIDQVRSVDGEPVALNGAPPSIELGTAAAPADGLRKGDTAFSIGGARQPGTEGKWGAAFFEDGVAAGTWGVTVDNPFPFSVVGAFSATRQ